MAAIPTLVYIGGVQIEGGQTNAFLGKPETDGAATRYEQGLVGLGLGKDQFGRGLPWDPLNLNPGSVPSFPAFTPYWDGNVAKYTGAVLVGGATATVTPDVDSTATAGGASTLTDSTQTWTTAEHFWKQVEIYGGTGAGQKRFISANTATQLTVSSPWSVVPDATSQYKILWITDALIGRKVRVKETYSGTSNANSTTTTIEVAGTPWTNNQHNGRTVKVTSGAMSGQTRVITATTTNTITWVSAMGAEPDTATFIIYGAGYSETYVPVTDNDTDTITAAWPAGNPDTLSTIEVKGDFVVYHHLDMAAADINPLFVIRREDQVACGDNWFTAERGGITPMTMLLNAWNGRYSASPYYRAIKFGQRAVTSTWNSGASWTAFETEYAFAVAREASRSNTLDVLQVVFDSTYEDIAAGTSTSGGVASTFGVALSGAIDAIRAKFPTAHIQVVNHHYGLYASGPLAQAGKAPAIRGIVVDVVALKSNCSVFDMSWAEFRPEVAFAPHWFSGVTIPATNPESNYRTEDYVEAGLRLYNAWLRATATPSVVPTSETGGIPTYILIGDSQMVGTNAISFVLSDDTLSLLGESPGYTVENRWVYNGSTNIVELADITSNTNTNGDVHTGIFGPEQTFMRSLAAEHPNGFVVLKYGRAGHALSTAAVSAGALGTMKRDAADDWLEIEAMWTAAKIAIPTDLNRIPDVRGIAVVLGDNDKLSAAAAAEFATEAGPFVDDLRELFATRTNGEVLAMVWLEPPEHLTNGGLSGHGLAAAATTVKAAVRDLATSKQRMRVLTASTSRYEVERVDTTHYSSSSTYNIGADLAAALIAINDDEAEAEPTEGPSGVASFTVETGSGAASSNSYCSVATADTYHIERGNPSVWADATTIQKQDWLRQATEAIDLTYSDSWPGISASSTQALAWPMAYAVDKAGYLISSDTIPTALQYATAMLALQLANGEVILPKTMASAGIASETNTVGAISRSVDYRGGKPEHTSFPATTKMLRAAGLIGWGGTGWGSARL